MAVLGFDQWQVVTPGAPRDPGPEDVLDAVESVPAGDVLVVAGGAEALRAARIAVFTLRRPDVAVIDLSGPPTRRVTLTYALQHLPPEAYGYADAVVATVQLVCRTRALLSSVSRLAEPRPSLTDHVAGWFPGQFFAVDVEGGTVRRMRHPHLTPSAGPFAVTASGWRHAIQPTVTPLPATTSEAVGPAGSGHWQAQQWWEVTVAQVPIADAVRHALATARPRRCPSCTRPVTGQRCRFCAVLVPGPPGPVSSPPGAAAPDLEESYA